MSPQLPLRFASTAEVRLRIETPGILVFESGWQVSALAPMAVPFLVVLLATAWPPIEPVGPRTAALVCLAGVTVLLVNAGLSRRTLRVIPGEDRVVVAERSYSLTGARLALAAAADTEPDPVWPTYRVQLVLSDTAQLPSRFLSLPPNGKAEGRLTILEHEDPAVVVQQLRQLASLWSVPIDVGWGLSELKCLGLKGEVPSQGPTEGDPVSAVLPRWSQSRPSLWTRLDWVLWGMLGFSGVVVGTVTAKQLGRGQPVTPMGVLMAASAIAGVLVIALVNRMPHGGVECEGEWFVVKRRRLLGQTLVRLPRSNTLSSVVRTAPNGPGHVLLVSPSLCVSSQLPHSPASHTLDG